MRYCKESVLTITLAVGSSNLSSHIESLICYANQKHVANWNMFLFISTTSHPAHKQLSTLMAAIELLIYGTPSIFFASENKNFLRTQMNLFQTTIGSSFFCLLMICEKYSLCYFSTNDSAQFTMK